MLPDKILQSDLLDILFENRNKNYGAYTLRKFYYKHMNIALSATIFLSACFTLIFLRHNHTKSDYITTVFIPPDTQLSNLKPDDPKTSQPPRVHTNNNFRQIINSTPVITGDNIKPTQPTVDETNNNIIADIKTNGDLFGDNPIAPPSSDNNDAPSSAIIESSAIDNNIPLISAEVMPEFPGGVNALVKFMLQNLHQADDLQPGEKIKVIAFFVISKTGTIENVRIISSGRADLDKEVIRVMNKMPLWKPGIQNGKAVSVYFNLPVTFQSADE